MISAGQTTTLDVALQPKGTIAGTVTDALTGLPLAGVNVDGRATTGADGSYVFKIDAGTHTITFSKSGYTTRSETGVLVTAGQTTTLDVALVKPGHGLLRGSVTDASTGSPIGLTIVEVTSGGNLIATTLSGVLGNYSLAVKTGTYEVFFSAIGYASEERSVLIAEGEVATVSVALQIGGQGTISGQVTDATTGAGIAGATVNLYTTRGAWMGRSVSDASGSYTMQATSGSFNVGFAAPGFGTLRKDAVLVEDETTTALDASLKGRAQLAGRVTDAVSGAPIADVAVYVKTTAGASVTNTTTNGDGSYSVPVAAGTYNVRYNLDWQLTEWQGVTEANVVMTSGQTTTLNKALAPSGVLAGRVTDAVSGAPIADVAVYVKTTAGASVTNTTTNGDGSYSVPVAAGTYNVRYNLDWQLTEWQGVTEANVVMTSGQTTTLNKALAPSGVLAGRVTDAVSGAPIADVAVYVKTTAGASVTNTTTNGDGSYSVPVAAGTYNVRYNLDWQLTEWQGVTEANVVMTSGQTTTLNKALAPSGVLAGRVTDAVSGAPIADVAVYVKTTAGASVTNTTTNGDGSYSVPVAAGTYNVRYNSTGS